MMKKLLELSFLLAAGASFGQTTVEGSFEHDGQTREYRLYIPEIYDDSRPTPLVFNLHGYTSNNEAQEAYGDFRPVADTANFIIVHPQGLNDDVGNPHWNTFGTSSVDDVGFLSSLIDTVYANYNIDGNRIYSTGMSNGGFMSYKLSCLLSGRIAAIASVTGTMTFAEFDACITNHPMPVMHIHGTADATVPYDGNLFFMPVEDIIDHWVSFNECNPDPIITDVPDTDPDDGCTAEHYLYEGGLLGSTVELYKIDAGEHTWPGAAFVTGVTNNDFNASAEIWRFFSQYTLNHLTSSIEEESTEISDFRVLPNPTSGDQATVYFDNSEVKTIRVHNFLGQVILENTTADKVVSLSLQEKGIYFVSVTQGSQTRTQKLVRN